MMKPNNSCKTTRRRQYIPLQNVDNIRRASYNVVTKLEKNDYHMQEIRSL